MAGIVLTIPNIFAGVVGTAALADLDDDFQAVVDAMDLAAALTDLPSAVNATGTRAWGKGANLSDGAAINLGADGNYFEMPSGATTVTSISTKQAGCIIVLRFGSARTLTHNATTLILMGATNATTAAGDLYWFISEGGGNWRELWRRPVTNATVARVFSGAGTWITPASSAFTLAGVNTTEVTDASGADVDLVTVTLSSTIAVGTPFIVIASLRKTTGAAAAAAVGLKVNSTEIRNVLSFTGATNSADNGIVMYLIGGWDGSNYTFPLTGLASASTLAATVVPTAGLAIPNATITTVTIRGNSGNSSITMGCKNVYVYALATS